MSMEPLERPTTILTEEEFAPRGPWSFLQSALPGGFTRWGWGLMLGWSLMLMGSTLGWASHLRRAAGWSALPGHWGENLSTRDLWELWENGGLQHRVLNSPTVHLLGLGLVVALWCGWRMQGETLGFRARLGPWLLGGLDTLLIGLIPVGSAFWAADSVLAGLGNMGIDGLGWIAFFGRPLLFMAAFSALNLQWWFCRLGRAAGTHHGYGRHLGHSFLRLWIHPVQWGVLVVAGATLRALLPFLVLLLAWRLGGGTALRVWGFFLLQLAVTLAGAWLLGWFLRTSALFWQHDSRVREVRSSLEESARETAQDA